MAFWYWQFNCYGVDKRSLQKKNQLVKVRDFRGATIDDQKYHLILIMKKELDNMLHNGTSDAACSTPSLSCKGSIKQDLSIHPSFHLSITFLGFGSVVFSEIQHGVRGPYIVVCDRARFFGKNPHWAKITKNGEK